MLAAPAASVRGMKRAEATSITKVNAEEMPAFPSMVYDLYVISSVRAC